MTHPLRFGLKLSGQDCTIQELRDVWRIAEDHYDALNAHDIDAYARAFTPDADFVTISGASQRGSARSSKGTGR